MNVRTFSIIIPVFNRPLEVDELLQSLTEQTYKDFEVIIVEDGSSVPCYDIVEQYGEKLTISYHIISNSGPGLARNHGANAASGQWLVFFDSDCIIPPNYFDLVMGYLNSNPCDAFGGPDRAHSSFTPVQKAINYSMTSFLTTGGIRGGKQKLDRFYPRSFNMGISRKAFNSTGGFGSIRFGEDVDLSLRIVNSGLITKLIPEAYVYHKRRTDFRKFYRQVYNSGIARITLHLLHPSSLKAVHVLPSAFITAIALSVLLSFFNPLFLITPLAFSGVLLADAFRSTGNAKVAILCVPAAWVQLTGYGFGFLVSFGKRVLLKHKKHVAYEKNFYQ